MNYEEKDITIEYMPQFRRDLKRLAKKYRSLPLDLKELKLALRENPLLGADLGDNLHKVRLAITSKGKGKSGGARVITHVLLSVENGLIRLLTIYDKSERSNITDKELRALMKACGIEEQ